MKLRIDLEIEITPFTREQLEAVGFEGEEAEPDYEAIDAESVGQAIAGLFYQDSEIASEALAGSDLFVSLGDADLIRAVLVEA